MLVQAESNEVYYPAEDRVSIAMSDIENLKHIARNSSKQCARLCTHRSPEETVQEMFIVQTCKAIVRPHRHVDKVESLFVLEGEAELLFFDVHGALLDTIPMGPIGSQKTHYFRLEKSVFHSLSIKSDFFVYHEVTQGPFLREKTIFPVWG